MEGTNGRKMRDWGGWCGKDGRNGRKMRDCTVNGCMGERKHKKRRVVEWKGKERNTK